MKKYAAKLDKEEKEILKAFEKGKLRRTSNFDEEMKFAKKAAKTYIKEKAHLDVTLSKQDIHKLEKKAEERKVPLLTFIENILHRYATENL